MHCARADNPNKTTDDLYTNRKRDKEKQWPVSTFASSLWHDAIILLKTIASEQRRRDKFIAFLILGACVLLREVRET